MRSTTHLAGACAQSRHDLLALCDNDAMSMMALGVTFQPELDRFGMPTEATMERAMLSRDMLRTTLVEADLYIADESFGALTREASTSMPVQMLLESDPLSPHGYVLFAEPLDINEPGMDEDDGFFPVQAVAWMRLANKRQGDIVAVFVFTTAEALRDAADEVEGAVGWAEMERTFGSLPSVAPCHVFAWRLNDLGKGEERVSGAVRRILTTFWTLSRQDLVVSEAEGPQRALRRRTQRRGVSRERAEAPVRVLRLQHYVTAAGIEVDEAIAPDGDASSEGKRQYRHSWMVRGFWRNTWFPSLGAHRVQWISPHVRGPKDKPLIGGEKVFLVRGQAPHKGT